jgi:diguanylate cyclase (GGDEF)-like protein
LGWTTGHQHDISTRTARVIRATLVRWAVLLVVPSALLLLWFATVASTAGPVLLLAVTLVVAFIAVIDLVMLRRLLRLVDDLDEERHGLRQAYDRARLDSFRDGLTGLGSHRAFQEELDEQVAVARERGRPVTLLCIDVDDLKATNSALGHAAGDEVLRATARVVSANIRRGDRGYRMGGDDFAVLLADCSPEEGVLIANRMLAGALGSGGTSGGGAFSLTIGVSGLPLLAADRQQLLHQANAALYWGKRHGRTDVQLFDPRKHGMADDDRPLDELAAAVSRVASGRMLTPVYQPLYDLRAGRVVGYEGLVRLKPDAGFPNPSALFVAAEATGHTVELDVASLEIVVAGARGLERDAYLAVNLSPRTLEAPGFNALELLTLARRNGIDPSRLVVELTEREAVEDLGRLRAAMDTLRRHGVRTAADDVGAGNAGLRLLTELAFDIMKVDLMLVRLGTARDSSDAVLRALRDLAQRRGQRIVAEGIETPEQLKAVVELGFDSGQGYLLGRPLPTRSPGAIDVAALIALADDDVEGSVLAPAAATS